MNIAKRPLLVGFLVLLSASALSQERKVSVVENNLYYRALFASLEKMDKEWGSQSRSNYRNMIVEENRNITEGLPSQLDEYRVEYLASQELIERYKKLRKEFPILRVYPMATEAERLEITFNVYWFSYGKGSLNYALSDWSKVYFRYDCEKREYVIDEIKLGGI